MASAIHSTPAPAQQPELPTFIICDRVPEGCTTFMVPDSRHEPLLSAGEWIICDPEDKEPVEGELFLIAWQSNPQRPQLVECAVQKKLSAERDQTYWHVGARHRGLNARALGWGSPGYLIGDGPYRSEQLTERFLGKVVGILEPAYREPTRPALCC